MLLKLFLFFLFRLSLWMYSQIPLKNPAKKRITPINAPAKISAKTFPIEYFIPRIISTTNPRTTNIFGENRIAIDQPSFDHILFSLFQRKYGIRFSKIKNNANTPFTKKSYSILSPETSINDLGIL